MLEGEDGIRVSSGTGVQTCGLPIFQAAPGLPAQALQCFEYRKIEAPGLEAQARPGSDSKRFPGADRSGERPGGRDGRSRWSRYTENKGTRGTRVSAQRRI